MTTNGVFEFQPCDNVEGGNASEPIDNDLFLPDNQSHRRTSMKQQVEICQQTVNPHCKVSMTDFDIIKCIGKGGYGKVYLVRKVSEGAHQRRLFAMKVLKKAVICRTEKDMVHTWSERNILEMIRHPFLVKLYYAFQNETNLNMILEYCPGGELFTYLESVGFVSEKKASFYISEIVLAIGHLHSYGIIYRDLKPENILLDRHGHCKLTDFGLSKESCDRTNTYCGTKEYMAPEIWLRKYHDKNVDWWCLGNLLYDMLAGYPPFANDDKSILREKILKENVEYPACFSEETISLLDGLLQKDPAKRLGAGTKDVNIVKEHRFFAKYNVCWEDVLLKRMEPPYKPFLKSETDTSQFDENFTSLAPTLSPVDPVATDLFQGFSYVGSGVAESFLETRPPHESRYRRRTASNATPDVLHGLSQNTYSVGLPINQTGGRPLCHPQTSVFPSMRTMQHRGDSEEEGNAQFALEMSATSKPAEEPEGEVGFQFSFSSDEEGEESVLCAYNQPPVAMSPPKDTVLPDALDEFYHQQPDLKSSEAQDTAVIFEEAEKFIFRQSSLNITSTIHTGSLAPSLSSKNLSTTSSPGVISSNLSLCNTVSSALPSRGHHPPLHRSQTFQLRNKGDKCSVM